MACGNGNCNGGLSSYQAEEVDKEKAMLYNVAKKVVDEIEGMEEYDKLSKEATDVDLKAHYETMKNDEKKHALSLIQFLHSKLSKM